MMKIHCIGIILTLLVSNHLQSQSFRGISVLNDSCSWISGSQGQVLFFENNWVNRSPQNPKYSIKDFRDIHAWNERSVIIMSAGDSGVLLRTEDSGKSWTEVFSDFRKGIFFDAFDFSAQHPELGILVGDPIGNKSHFYSLFTIDSGKTWNDFNKNEWNLCSDNLSSFFAASGSSVKIISAEKQNDSLYSVELAFGGHGDSATSIIITQVKININSLNDSFSSTYSYALNLPKGDGVGIYSIDKIDDSLIIIGGGSWKYPNNNDFLKEYSSAWLLDYSTQIVKFKPLKINQYISGITAYMNVDKQINWACGGTNGIVSNNKFVQKQTAQLKNINAVKFSENYLWIIGSQNQHIRLPLSPTK